MRRRNFIRTTGLGAGGILPIAEYLSDERDFETSERTSQQGNPVEIKTDRYGVSHLYASNIEALSFGMGYVQARDRLFQLDALRHIGYGNSASILGPDQLKSDIIASRDLPTTAELQSQFQSLDSKRRQSLEAFAAGVNAKVFDYFDEGRSMPAEFPLLRHWFERWKPVDSVAVINYLMGFFGVGGGHELENARTFMEMANNIGSERAAWDAYSDLNWLQVPENHSASISPDESRYTGNKIPMGYTDPETGEFVVITTIDLRQYRWWDDVPTVETNLDYDDVPQRQLEVIRAARNAQPWGIQQPLLTKLCGSETFGESPITRHDKDRGVLSGLKWGSNALIVDGNHTNTRKPMLVGGPQMGYFKPPVIYEVGLHGGGFNVSGVAIVGTPGIVVGRTPNFSWSVTSGADDQIDTIAVDLHENVENNHQYRWGGEWHEFETFEVHHDTFSTPAWMEAFSNDSCESFNLVKQEVARIEEHGEVMPILGWSKPDRIAYARRKTTRGDALEAAFMWMDLGRQEGLADFKRTLQNFPYSFNFHYIDDQDIAYIHTCKVPDRNPALDHRFPEPESMHEWRRMHTGRDAKLEVTNPDKGYVVNWNNAPMVGWRAGDREQRWGSHNRVEVLDRTVREEIYSGKRNLNDAYNEAIREFGERLDFDDLKEILLRASNRDPNAPASAPAIIEAARESNKKVLNGMAFELEQWAHATYPWADWDRDEAYDHEGHVIWDLTRRGLQQKLFKNVMGDHYPELFFNPSPEKTGLGVRNKGEQKVDPHAADHGLTFKEVTFVDALNGDTSYDWFGGDNDVAPTSAFSVDNRTTVKGQSVHFQASPSHDDGSIVDYAWDFDDGTTANGRSVSHTYGSLGVYDVTLTVTDNTGNTNSYSDTISVAISPQAAISGCGSTHETRFAYGRLGSGNAESHVYKSQLDDPCGLNVILQHDPSDDFNLYVNLDGTIPVPMSADKETTSTHYASSVSIIDSEIDPDDEFGILVDSASGSGVYALIFAEYGNDQTSSHPSSRNSVIRRLLVNVYNALDNLWGDDQHLNYSGEFRNEYGIHISEFTAIGATESETIPMVNRGTYNILVSWGEEAKSILPPSNSGYISLNEWRKKKINNDPEPARLDDQLHLYTRHQYKELPVTRSEVNSVTQTRKTITY